MKQQEKLIIGIGLVIGVLVLLAIGLFNFFSDRDEETNETFATTESTIKVSDRVTEKTTDSLAAAIENVLDDGEQTTSESIEIEDEQDRDYVDNAYIEWQQTYQYEQKIDEINREFVNAYYSNDEPKERNLSLKKLMTEQLFEEQKLPETGQVIQPHIDSISFETFSGSITNEQAIVVNIVDVVADSVPQKMLITVSFVQAEDWIIDGITFDVIRTNSQN